MTTASAPSLRPLGLGELLDQTIRLYRKNFFNFIGIIAVVQIPLSLVSLLFSMFTMSGMLGWMEQPNSRLYTSPLEMLGPSYCIGMSLSLLWSLVSFVLLQGIATAAMGRAVADNYLGERTGFVAAYQKIFGNWQKVIKVVLLLLLLEIGLVIWAMVPCLGWLSGMGPFLIFSMVLVPIAAQISVLENHSVSGSVRRAWELIRRRFWPVVGVAATLTLFSMLIVAGPSLVFTYIFQAVYGNPLYSDNPTLMYSLQTGIQNVISIGLSLIYYPVQLIGLTLLYFDLRVRTEGFDLALLAHSAAGTELSAAEAVATTAAPPAAASPLVTPKELGNFILLSLAFWGIFIIFYAALFSIAMIVTLGLMGPR